MDTLTILWLVGGPAVLLVYLWFVVTGLTIAFWLGGKIVEGCKALVLVLAARILMK